MIKELVIHLGDRKAGSTSIQHALARGAWVCKDVDLLYPAKLNHIPLAKTLTRKKTFARRATRFQKLAVALGNSNADVAVISAEDFESTDPRVVKDTFEKYMPDLMRNARLISYVRPHAERVLSSYAQQVKMGLFAGTLEEFHKTQRRKRRFFYHKRFSLWRKTFGDQFTLRPMIRRELRHEDVVEDFLDFTLKGADFQIKDIVQSNETLSLEELAMISVLHKELGEKNASTVMKTVIGRRFARIFPALESPQRQTKPRIHKGLIPDIVKTYRKDAANLDRDFFTGTPMTDALDQAYDKAIDTPQSILPEDHFTVAELRLIHGWAKLVAEMAGSNPGALKEHLQKLTVSEVKGNRK